MHTKRLEQLDLLDNFMFGKLTTHPIYGPIFCKLILQIILNRPIGNIQIIPQKVYYGADTDKHGVRLDVYVEETEDLECDTVYDIEPDKNEQKDRKDALPKRVRFYHAKIDENSLQSGDDYSNLKRVIVIMITPYDPFNSDRMVYTIKRLCVEEPQMPYDDGSMTLYLYTKGTQGNPRKELQDLLHYMEESKKENVDNKMLEEIHRMVEGVKHNKEVELEYMKIFEHEKFIHDDGIAEGLAKGNAQLIEIIRKKITKNMTISDIAEMLELDETYVTQIVTLIEQNPNDTDIDIATKYLATNS